MSTRLREAYDHLARSEGDAPLWKILLVAVHAVSAFLRALVRDELFIRAATLSYWTLVAIVPVFLLAFSLLGPLGLLEDATTRLKHALFETVLSSSVVEVGDWLDGMMAQVRLQALGVVGFLGVLVAGSKIYFSIEQTYNDIFKVRIRRSWILRITLFYALVTLGPLLLAAGFVITSRLGDSVPAHLFGRIVPVLLTTAAFVLMIKLLPQVDVKWTAALAGGLTSGVLFEIAKFAFGVYTLILNANSTVARLYGSLALFPIFLAWLYLLWVITLLGVELAYVVQNANALMAAERDRLSGSHRWRKTPDAVFGLQVMLAVTASWLARRGPATESDIAAWLGVSGPVVSDALEILENANQIARAEGGGFLPARPVESMAACEVVRAYREISTPRTRVGAPGGTESELALDGLCTPLQENVAEMARRFMDDETSELQIPVDALP
jgi:YihY family inner membrane protein